MGGKLTVPIGYLVQKRYKCLKELGEGHSFKVYKFEDDYNLGTYYAIKKVPKQVIDKDPKLKDLYHREVSVMKSLSCPNILNIHDIIETNHSYYILYQYCNKGNLSQFQKKSGRLTENEAVYCLKQIMNAFQEMQKHRITHRNIKLENIFFDDDKILMGGFGLAKPFTRQDAMFNSLGRMKPSMVTAPEQQFSDLKDEFVEYSSNVDLWSIGIIFYQMLFVKEPFNPDTIDRQIFMDQLQLHSGKYLDFPEGENPISSSCKDLLIGLIQFYPSDRIKWKDFFNHKLFKEHNKKGLTDISKNGIIENVIYIYPNKSEVNRTFQKNQTIQDNDTVGQIPADRIDQKSLDNKNKVKPESEKKIKVAAAIQQKKISLMKQIRALFIHEKKVIIVMINTCRDNAKIVTQKLYSKQIFDSVRYCSLIISKKAWMMNKRMIQALKKRWNNFSIEFFDDFIDSNYANGILETQQDDDIIYEENYQNLHKQQEKVGEFQNTLEKKAYKKVMEAVSENCDSIVTCENGDNAAIPKQQNLDKELKENIRELLTAYHQDFDFHKMNSNEEKEASKKDLNMVQSSIYLLQEYQKELGYETYRHLFNYTKFKDILGSDVNNKILKKANQDC